MRFRLPKPLHGWREFAGEVGIIVLGVLMALGAGQVVDWLQWQDKVRAANEALKGELTDAYEEAAERIIQTPCLNAQLDVLRARVLGSGATLTPAPVVPTVFGPMVYRHSERSWDDTIWQSTLSEQVSSHFSQTERQNLAATYHAILNMRQLNTEEIATDGLLNALDAPLPLDPSLRGHFIELIEAERERANVMSLLAAQQMRDEQGVIPDLNEVLRGQDFLQFIHQPKSMMSFCRARHFPLATTPEA